MKKFFTLLPLVLVCSMLSSCDTDPPAETDGMQILATTYPVYCFVTAVTDGVDQVSVNLLINQSVSCLHDYTLTVNDMKCLERADVIVLNGVGLEDFMADALTASDAALIDCSQGVELLELSGHEGHNHDAEYDPHIWMDPLRAAQMVQTICDNLCLLDSANADRYRSNTEIAIQHLNDLYYTWSDIFLHLDGPYLITFHEGFSYLAEAFHFKILCSIEEEEGSEISAKEIAEIDQLIRSYDLPAIFTEENGSDVSALAIARDTGVEIHSLSMVMSGEEDNIYPYLSAIDQNMATILEAMEATVS